MKQSSVVVLGFVLAAAGVLPAYAQVVPSATSHRMTVNAGAEGSMFQPDYAGNGIAQTGPNRLYGVGAYADADFTRWIGIEAEAHWLRWNQYQGIAQSTYMAGPRFIAGRWKGVSPYGKFLIGWGSDAGSKFSWLTGRSTVWSYGGGVDYRLGQSRFTVRCIDFEYQNWRLTPNLHPYGGSAGISYRVF